MRLLGATLNLTLNAVGGRAPVRERKSAPTAKTGLLYSFVLEAGDGVARRRRRRRRSINKWLSDAFSVLIRD